MIRGVFFDAGNTILFPDYYIYRDICEALGVESAINEIVRAEAKARRAFDRSVANSPGTDVYDFWSVYYKPFFQVLGVPSESIPDAIEMTRVANDTGLGIWKQPVEGLDSTPYAHIDIAGPAWDNAGKPHQAAGGTGFGVQLIVEAVNQIVG